MTGTTKPILDLTQAFLLAEESARRSFADKIEKGAVTLSKEQFTDIFTTSVEMDNVYSYIACLVHLSKSADFTTEEKRTLVEELHSKSNGIGFGVSAIQQGLLGNPYVKEFLQERATEDSPVYTGDNSKMKALYNLARTARYHDLITEDEFATYATWALVRVSDDFDKHAQNLAYMVEQNRIGSKKEEKHISFDLAQKIAIDVISQRLTPEDEEGLDEHLAGRAFTFAQSFAEEDLLPYQSVADHIAGALRNTSEDQRALAKLGSRINGANCLKIIYRQKANQLLEQTGAQRAPEAAPQ